MHDLDVIERLNEESVVSAKMKEHIAGGGHAVAEYVGLHLTRWFAFADAESAEAYAKQHGGQTGITLEVRHPKVAPASEQA